MKPIKSQLDGENSTARVYQDLRQLIIEKKIPPGSRVNQNKLAKALQISRTPLVKALHKLESEGLVDNIPQKGFYVHQMAIKELVDLFALREAIDSIIITGIVETITDEQITRLEEIINEFSNGHKSEDKNKYWHADMKFHSFLLSLSDNDLAKKVNDNFQVYNRTFAAGLVRTPDETLPEHHEIIEALRSRSPQAAKKAAIKHITITRELLQEVTSKLGQLGADLSNIYVDDFSKIQQNRIK